LQYISEGRFAHCVHNLYTELSFRYTSDYNNFIDIRRRFTRKSISNNACDTFLDDNNRQKCGC